MTPKWVDTYKLKGMNINDSSLYFIAMFNGIEVCTRAGPIIIDFHILYFYIIL